MINLGNIGQRWRQMRFNPLRSLTPERLSSALDAWSAGWLREASLIFESIGEREAIVKSVLSKRAAAVARRDWEVVVPDKDHPDAEAHKTTLEYFYNNLTVTDSTDLNVRTGMAGLIRQMMDAVLQKYAAHEIVWKPTEDGLTAELRRVPIYFFENRSGRLRFIGAETRMDGEPLEENGWMITVADGVGHALAIVYMFRRLAVQDWVAYSEKFSIPGVLGRTSAQSGTKEADSFEAAVAAFASDWSGTLTGDDGNIPEPIKILTVNGGANLPQKELTEYCDRIIATVVRGGDLSTISREKGTGSNPQQQDADALLEDDCAMVSETLQTQLDKLVIRMVHGDVTPAAYVVINPPSNQDLTADLTIDKGLSDLGVKQDPEDLAERYGRSVIKTPEVIGQPSTVSGEEIVAPNEADPTDAAMEKIRAALCADLQPLGDALAAAMQAGDMPAMQAALKKISKDMPTLAGDSQNLSAALAAQMADDLTTD